MRKRFIACTSILLGVLCLTACNTTEGDWAKAKAVNTSSAYSAFLKEHGEGAHAEEAKSLVESLDWNAARAAGTIAAYQGFLSEHPTGPDSEAAGKELRELRWVDANRVMTPDAFTAYLKDYPTSPYADEARARISALGLTRAGFVQIIEGYGATVCSGSFSATIGLNGEIGNPRDGAGIQVVVFRDVSDYIAQQFESTGTKPKPGAAYLRWNHRLLYIRDLSPDVLRSDSRICGLFHVNG